MWPKSSKHKISFFPLFLKGKEHHAKYNVDQQARNKINSHQLHTGELGLHPPPPPASPPQWTFRSWFPEGGRNQQTIWSYHWTQNSAANPKNKCLHFVFLCEKQHISVFSSYYPPKKKKKIKTILIPAPRENNYKHCGVLKFNITHSVVSLPTFYSPLSFFLFRCSFCNAPPPHHSIKL